MTAENGNPSLPKVLEVRQRIESVKEKEYRFALMDLWLIDGRVSETVGRKCPSDKKTTPRGPRGGEVDFITENGEEVALLHVRTSKRDGLPRVCAHPMAREYEPWAKDVAEYVASFSESEVVFPFTRQKLWEITAHVFDGLTYDINKYTNIVYVKDKSGSIERDERGDPLIGSKSIVNAHPRPFRLHGIRHLVATDKVMFYGFDGMDLSIFGGWTLRTMLGISASIERYVVLDWRRYFHKQLRKRRWGLGGLP